MPSTVSEVVPYIEGDIAILSAELVMVAFACFYWLCQYVSFLKSVRRA